MMHRHHEPGQHLWTRTRLLLLLLLGVATRQAWGKPSVFTISLLTGISSLPQSCQTFGKSSPEISELLLSIASRPSSDSYHALGEGFAQQNQIPCAIAAYKLALELDPRAWNVRYSLALTLLQTGDSDRAARELRTVIGQEPNSFMAHNALGLALEERGELEGAREEYGQAVRLNSSFALGYYNLAHVLSMQKRFSAAVFYSQKAVSLDTQEPAYQLALGIAYSEEGKIENSIQVLRKLIASHPDFIEAYINLGTVYGRQEHFDKAVKSYRQALKFDPGNLEALLSLGIALVAKLQPNEAIGVLKNYIARQPSKYQGYYWLGRAYKYLTQYQEAADALEKASLLNTDDYEVRYNLGVVLIHLGRLREGARQLEEAKKLNPQGADVRYQLADVRRRLNDPKEANEELKAFQALKLRDQQKVRAVKYHNEGNELLAAGKFAQAAEQFRQALALDPDSPRLHYNLSLALKDLGDREGQKRELETAIQLDPNLAPAHYWLGQFYRVQGDLSRAEQALKTAVAIDPQLVEAQDSLSSLQGSGRPNH